MKPLRIGIFLPQFHPDPLNDFGWGKGFTDWVTTFDNKKRYSRHVLTTPKFKPYDLSNITDLSERINYYFDTWKINALSFYDYRFDFGKSALSTPLDLYRKNLNTGKFCLWWVNVDWTRSWVGLPNQKLVEQNQSNDFLKHLALLYCKYFDDPKYLRFDERPILIIHRPEKIDLEYLRNQFITHGHEPYILAPSHATVGQYLHLVDKLIDYPPGDFISQHRSIDQKIASKIFRKNIRFVNYEKYLFEKVSVRTFRDFDQWYQLRVTNDVRQPVPCIFPGWDNTPRYKYRGFIIKRPSINEWTRHKHWIEKYAVESNNLIFIKALNEWAEGNALEALYESNYSNFDGKALDNEYSI